MEKVIDSVAFVSQPDGGAGCKGCVAFEGQYGDHCRALFMDTKCLGVIWSVKAKDTGEPLPVGQFDPNGKDLHTAGAKADAGKAEYDMALYSFPQALAAVDAIGKFGAQKYTKGGFLDVPDGQRRYLNAELRHAAQHEGGETHDPESGKLHLAHKAWNALAHLELYLRGKGE